jgi:hypothetical protein
VLPLDTPESVTRQIAQEAARCDSSAARAQRTLMPFVEHAKLCSYNTLQRSLGGRRFGAVLAPKKRVRLRRRKMLWTIFIILLVLWLLGLVSGYTLGGFIHILLVIAIVVVLIRVISGRRPV